MNRHAVFLSHDADWKPSPFQDLANRLAEKSRWVRELDARAREIVRDPMTAYGNRPDGQVVQAYRAFCEDSSFGVRSLSGMFGEWRDFQVRAIAFKEYESEECHEMEVNGWLDALAMVMNYVAESHAEEVSLLEENGLLAWVRKRDPEMGMAECWRQGSCEVKVKSKAEAGARVQWLFLMCGIPLTDVAVRYARRHPVPILKICPVCGIRVRKLGRHMDKAHKGRSFDQHMTCVTNADHGNCVNTSTRRLGVPTPIGSMGKKKKKKGSRGHSPKTWKYEAPQNDGYLISPDGIVVGRISRSCGSARCESSVTRSESDCEDYWKGFGHIARDNGRYGSIDGVDYAD